MTVFADIAAAVADVLDAIDTHPESRRDVDVAVQVNRSADITVTAGASVPEWSSSAYTDWRTEIVVHISARASDGTKLTVAQLADRMVGRIWPVLSLAEGGLRASLEPLAMTAVGGRPGDLRIDRDVEQLNTAVGQVRVIVPVYHRTVGYTLQPWPTGA